MSGGLAVIETHPVQYHAPVYRRLQQQFGIPVTAIYGSDFSVAGYRDREFGVDFAWDNDLLSGYNPIFLSRVADGGARSVDALDGQGIAAALRHVAPRAVLLVGYSSRFYRAAIQAAWAGGYPLLFRAETTDHARVRNQLKASMRDVLLRQLYRRCAALLYIGQRSHEHYQRLGCPEERLVFAPYCVDTSTFAFGETERSELRCRTRATLGIADGRIAILFAGKLVPRKRPDLLIAALRLLPTELSAQIELVWLGDGEQREQLQALAAQAPTIPTHFCGFQNQRALSQYYHAADLMVLPSASDETWGLVVNEALHHGLPCVVSDMVGCAPDLIVLGATGEVFAADSAAQLALALVRACGLVGRADVRDHCRQHVALYSVDHAAAGVAEGYRRVQVQSGPTQ